MLIDNAAIAMILADKIDEMTAKLKDKLANVQPLAVDPAKELALTWHMRGEIQGLERFKKKLLSTDEDKDS